MQFPAVIEMGAQQVATKTQVIQQLNTAQQALNQAYQLGCTANAMCADTQVFKEMQVIGKQITAMLLEVNKLRGL